MNRLLTLIALIFLFFFAELVCMNFLGRFLIPNFLILLVIFIDLHLGVRFGLFTAVLAGILQDSFGTAAFGIHTFSFVFCVYVTTLLRRYFFYDMEFGFFRVLMACFISFLNVFTVYLLISLSHALDFWEATVFIIIPQVLVTTLLSTLIFKVLKRCVLKLSV